MWKINSIGCRRRRSRPILSYHQKVFLEKHCESAKKIFRDTNMRAPDFEVNKPLHRNNRFPVLQLAYRLCQTGFIIFSYISLTPTSDLSTSKISTNMQKSFLSTGRAHGSVSTSSDLHREGADLIPGWSRFELWCTEALGHVLLRVIRRVRKTATNDY